MQEIGKRETEVDLATTNVLARSTTLDEELAEEMAEFTSMSKNHRQCGGKAELSTRT